MDEDEDGLFATVSRALECVEGWCAHWSPECLRAVLGDDATPSTSGGTAGDDDDDDDLRAPSPTRCSSRLVARLPRSSPWNDSRARDARDAAGASTTVVELCGASRGHLLGALIASMRLEGVERVAARGPAMAPRGRGRRRIRRERPQEDGRRASAHRARGRANGRLVDAPRRPPSASLESIGEKRQPPTIARRRAPSSALRRRTRRLRERDSDRGERGGGHGRPAGAAAVPCPLRESNPRPRRRRRRRARDVPRRSPRAKRGAKAEPDVPRGADTRVLRQTPVAARGATRRRASRRIRRRVRARVCGRRTFSSAPAESAWRRGASDGFHDDDPAARDGDEGERAREVGPTGGAEEGADGGAEGDPFRAVALSVVEQLAAVSARVVAHLRRAGILRGDDRHDRDDDDVMLRRVDPGAWVAGGYCEHHYVRSRPGRTRFASRLSSAPTANPRGS